MKRQMTPQALGLSIFSTSARLPKISRQPSRTIMARENFDDFLAHLIMFLDDIAWIIQKATDHLKTLSSAEKTDVAESEADFNQNYGRAGLKLAHANV